MFTQHFEYRKINCQVRTDCGTEILIHTYSFKGNITNGKQRRYIAVVEQYDYSTYAVKFYDAIYKNRKDKYNILTNANECTRILTTVGRIMIEILKYDPYASFVFIGSELQGESKRNTKRFRVYSRVVGNVISPTQFEHRTLKKISAYLMLNRSNKELELLDKITDTFNRIYEF